MSMRHRANSWRPCGCGGVLLLLLCVLTAGARVGRAAVPPDGLANTEVGQQQLRTASERVAGQLDIILEEFQRNGLGGEDVELLGAIRSVLGQLNERDMARVVALLHEARELGETGVRRARLLEAFSTQKGVGYKLRQILLQYQRQQELAGVAARLHELAHRQGVAMFETLALASSVAGRRREWLSENQRISLQLLSSEQQSLSDEVTGILGRLESWVAEGDEETVALAAAALRGVAAEQLGRAAGEVVRDLGGGYLLSATGRQRALRGLMREVARQLLSPPDELEALQAAVHRVEGLIGRQEEQRTVTRQLASRPQSWAPLVRQQLELVDDTDLAREEVVRADSAAGEQVSAAVGRMQEARGILDTTEREARERRLAAATQQEMALARLETARRLLRERMELLEKQRQAMSDPISNLQQVRADVAELLERQRAFNADAAQVEREPAALRPLAPRQGDLGDRTDDATERAALDLPSASEQLAEAAQQMRRSQRSLGEGRNAPGPQQAAMDALARALAMLDEQLAALAAAEKELAALEALLERLIALIEAQQALNADTARVARGVPVRTPAELAGGQNGLGTTARELQAASPETVPRAAMYLGEAAVRMDAAAGELTASRVAEARPSQDEALDFLHLARKELEDRVARLKSMLGLPADEVSLEALAEMIRSAQDQVGEALSAEALAEMGRDLQQAGRRIQPATSGRMGRLPPMIRNPLQAAERSLMEGSAAAEAGQQSSAEGSAGEAQQALAAAAAALDLAMAGMGQQPGEGQGQGQGGEGNQAGQGQGQGRGRAPGSRAGKGTGDAGNFFGAGGGDGPRRSTTGSGRFIGLPARERAALLQSQGERYPQEYAPMIEQYLKNLSDQVEGAPR